MDYTKFIDRRDERAFLRKALSSKEFEFIPVWGRRRVGKTTLLLKAIGDRGIYFLANEATEIENLRHFKEDAARALDDKTILDLTSEWEAIFRYLAPKNPIIVIDEFPYLIVSNSSIPSIFQRIIDLHLSKTSSKLILCGSSIRMMENTVLNYRAPLYGRRTGQLKVLPLDFNHLKEFLNGYGLEDIVRSYGACGGIPLYIMQFDPKIDFWRNVESCMFDTNALLYAEADLLLKQEFTQLSKYKSILNAVAIGKVKMSEIKNHLQETKSDISPYLNKLTEIGVIKKIVPVTEDPERSRRGVYLIDDRYLNFHFRYVRPYRSLIEYGDVKGVLNRVKQDYDAYIGKIFEIVVTEAFFIWSRRNNKVWDRVGPWWYKEDEIDLLALSSDKEELLSCEIKWSGKRLGKGVINTLIERTGKVRWRSRRRKEEYLVVSRGGFTRSCIEYMEEKGVIYWTLEDLEGLFWPKPKKRGKGKRKQSRKRR